MTAIIEDLHVRLVRQRALERAVESLFAAADDEDFVGHGAFPSCTIILARTARHDTPSWGTRSSIVIAFLAPENEAQSMQSHNRSPGRALEFDLRVARVDAIVARVAPTSVSDAGPDLRSRVAG
jgi:hypothetical protein